jgi:predicted RNase H-like nuclease (RuvC/YqgF family)
LKQCQATIARLEEENRQLRKSAAAFGQLAERLNEELRRERRRRESPRQEDTETPAGHRRHR